MSRDFVVRYLDAEHLDDENLCCNIYTSRNQIVCDRMIYRKVNNMKRFDVPIDVSRNNVQFRLKKNIVSLN